MTPEDAFHCQTLASVKDHPKTLAYRESVSRLKGRDRDKDVVINEARFHLLFKVQHQLPAKSEDCLFHGIKTEPKQNFLYVELIGDMVDGYSPMKGSQVLVASVCSIRSPPFVSGGPLSTHDENENGDDDLCVC
jgi:hypothetical protein